MPDPVGIPGSNPAGSQVANPGPGMTNTAAIGGVTNPLLPTFPAGMSTPGMSDPTAALAGMTPNLTMPGGMSPSDFNALVSSLHGAGYSTGVGGAMAGTISNDVSLQKSLEA